jgi:hypothetical protein
MGENRYIPILFSGVNSRAVISLCRFFESSKLHFYIIASSEDDEIFQTKWRENILFIRKSKKISVQIMKEIAKNIKSHKNPMLVSTSEFLNSFALIHRQELEDLGWVLPYPEKSTYNLVGNKLSSTILMRPFLKIPQIFNLGVDNIALPCILKPKKNIIGSSSFYPIFCEDINKLQTNLALIDQSEWFAQTIITGQSYYFCSYIKKDGTWCGFWQENLLQQPGGKSMLFSRTCGNPGLQLEQLMENLHSAGYFGPLMIEVLKDRRGDLYYIECNTRFWGPLELARIHLPEVLSFYLLDIGIDSFFIPPKLETESLESKWYSWAYGLYAGPPKQYPAFKELDSKNKSLEFIMSKDVYGLPDTLALHGRY